MALRKLTITEKNEILLDGEEVSDAVLDYQLNVNGSNGNVGYLTITFLVQVASLGIPVEKQEPCCEEKPEKTFETSVVNDSVKLSLRLSMFALALSLVALWLAFRSIGRM